MKKRITIKKMLTALFLLCLGSSAAFAQVGDNSQDPLVNLGCLDNAVVTGSVDTSISGGKMPDDILWNPATNDYKSVSDWHEYGLGFNEIVGDATPDNPVWWSCEWPTAKNINYLTITGTYGNQPQPTTGWSIEIDSAGTWVTLAKAQDGWAFDSLKGAGGWVNDGLIELRLLEPVVTTKIRFCAYANPDSLADGVTNRADSLWSFSWTGLKKSATAPHACLIQYLDFSGEAANNKMDDMVNLGLLDEAVVSSNLKKGELNGEPLEFIRGEPADILFDPVANNFHNTQTDWGEFGLPYNYDAGYPTSADEGFYWQVEWPVPKKVNYFTWGGIYGNQPQPDTPWEVQYWENGAWVTVLDGVGGSLADGGPGVDDGAESVWQTETPIETTKFRLAVYSDGITPLWSYSLRGRGGSTNNWDETDSTFKAILLQYKDLTTDISVDESVVPNEFSLEQNYPNPFNPETTIKFAIPKQSNVRLTVYNTLGQEVATLLNNVKSAGTYKVQFNANNLSSGLYIYRLETDNRTITKKMMLLK